MNNYYYTLFFFLVIGASLGMGVFIASYQSEDQGVVREESSDLLTVTIPDGYDRESLAGLIGDAMGWDDAAKGDFARALEGIQWDVFNGRLQSLFGAEFNWDDKEREIFLTHSARILQFEPDILEYAYVPGMYEFQRAHSPAEVAELLVAKIREHYQDPAFFLSGRITAQARTEVDRYVKNQIDLLPDLVALPPMDVGIRDDEGRMLLVFGTTYYNIGNGNLEIIADPETAGIPEDIERDVFQRIYRTDGSYRDRLIGTFLWHQEHLHYHYEDFVEYSLESISADARMNYKATYCVRDITRMRLRGKEDAPAKYLVCGKEIQGVSVGWGDTYFHTYSQQNFDISDLPSGVYQLTFHINPEERFEEFSTANNQSSARIEIDKEKGTVVVRDRMPSTYPEFEHERKEQ